MQISMLCDRWRQVATWAVAGALLGGCAAFQPPPLKQGQSEAEVMALLGLPTARHAMPQGVTRLEFATGPFGGSTWMVDLGPDGRSLRHQQVLSIRYFTDFAERAPGMSIDDLLRNMGQPADKRSVGWLGVQVWSWRYANNDCLLFQVSIGKDAKVIDAGYGPDPVCEHRRLLIPR